MRFGIERSYQGIHLSNNPGQDHVYLTFLTGEGIQHIRIGISIAKKLIRLQKVKNVTHFVCPSILFGAKNGSTASGNSLVVPRVSPGRIVVLF